MKHRIYKVEVKCRDEDLTRPAMECTAGLALSVRCCAASDDFSAAAYPVEPRFGLHADAFHAGIYGFRSASAADP